MTGPYRIGNTDLALTLDSEGRLLLLETAHRGNPVLRAGPGEAQPLLLAWTSTGPHAPLVNWHLRAVGDTAAGPLLLGQANGLELAIEARRGSGGLLIRLQVLNRGPCVLERLRFQISGPLDVGAAPRFTYPANSGWSVPVSAFSADELLSLGYPVHGSMQWGDLYTTEQGLFLAVQDPLPYLKRLLLGRQRGQPTMAWEFLHLRIAPGESFRFPALHLASHSGDWRAGADLYRAWIEPYLARPSPPLWYARSPAWNWVGLRGQGELIPWHGCNDLSAISARTADLGPELIQLTAYTEKGHDTGYPDYVVGPSNGGEDSLRQAVRAIHAVRRRLSIYTNGRLVDPDSSVTADQRESWGVRASGPTDPVWWETYGAVTFDVMCPSVREWGRLFQQRLVHLVRRYDVDGIYVDQVCGCAGLPCYASDHPHQRPSEAWAAYKPFVATLRLALREIKPELFLATEGVNDLLGQYFDSMQSHEDWDEAMRERGEVLPELYRYTIPQHLLNVGCIRANKLRYLYLGHTLGSGLDLGIAALDMLEPAFRGEARWIVEQRMVHDDVMRGGSFHPLLATDDAGFRVNAFRRGRSVVLASAPEDGPITAAQGRVQVAVPWPYEGAPIEASASSPEGPIDAAIEWRGDGLRVCLPTHAPCLVRLEGPHIPTSVKD